MTDNNTNRGVGFDNAVFEDDILTLAGADTLLAGTILARSSATGKLVLFVKGGSTAENGIPKVVLPYELTVAGAGDVAVRPLVRGQALTSRLVIDADGDSSNIDAAVRDQLRSYGIIARASVDGTELEA